MKLRIGYVPEHFSTPLFFAKEQGYYKDHGLDLEFVPFPSGSGHLIQSLKDKSIGRSQSLYFCSPL
jgi:ABC-type nitrate/sulfonate/bicarbonate transport system substrate-binding protein